jgi:hypothetical protein
MNAVMLEGAARPSRTQRRRSAAALGAALLVHLGAGWMTSGLSARPGGQPGDEPVATLDRGQEPMEIEPLVIDDVERAAPSRAESEVSDHERVAELAQPAAKGARHASGEPSQTAERAAHSAPAPAAPSAERAPNAIEPPAEQSPTASENPPGAEAPAASVSPGNGVRQPIDLGIGPGGWKRWMDTAAAGETPAASAGSSDSTRPGAISVYRPQPKSATGGVQELLEAHDRDVGLGSSGPVKTALEKAAHTDVAPQLGTARFVVTVLASGAVEVALAAASDRASEWREVGSRAAEQLRKKPPRIPPSRKGVRMTIQVEAVEQLVNGADPKGRATHLVVVPPAIKSQKDSEEDSKERNPVASTANADNAASPPLRLNIDLPGVFLEGRGKVCGYRIGITPLGPMLSGGCDPSVIGSKPVRVVSTKVLDETML